MKINLPIRIVRLVFEACKHQWQSDSVRNLITLSNGKSMTKSMMTLGGEYPVYGANGVIGKTDNYLVENPTITVGRVGSCGEINLTTGFAWISDNAMWTSSIREGIDYSFMYYGLKSLDLSSGAKIAAMPSISQENVYRETLPIPSIEEQKIIAQYLDQFTKGVSPGKRVSLPESIKAIEQTIERIEYLAACIAQAQSLREEINEETNLFFSRILSETYDEALTSAGKAERLEELCTVITDGTHVTPSYMDEGIPFLSVKDITSGKIDFSRTRFISPEEHAFLTKRCKPEKDDVLLTKVGTTGFAKAIDVDREFSIFVSLALLKINKNRLLPKYTEYMLNSPKLREQSLQGTRGVGNKNLVLKFIKEYPMPAPPLDEQRRIVAYLDSVQARLASLRELQSQTGEELSALLPSVLDRAFKGES